MEELPFDWDDEKAFTNFQKHRGTFEEASTVFSDLAALIVADEYHSDDELRELIVGFSDKSRLLFVVFTEKPDAIRIISARMETKRERGNLPINSLTDENDDILPEFEVDYSRAQPNRFTKGLQKHQRMVVLDSDVAEVFTTSESVNKVLRGLIETMPKQTA